MDIINSMVLVIDSDKVNYRFIELLFAEANIVNMCFQLINEDTFGGAVDRLNKGDIDVVILEPLLPDADRVTALDAVYAVAKNIPIIVFTSSENHTDAVEMINRGADDVITKGTIGAQGLIRAVRLAIERKHMKVQQEESSSISTAESHGGLSV